MRVRESLLTLLCATLVLACGRTGKIKATDLQETRGQDLVDLGGRETGAETVPVDLTPDQAEPVDVAPEQVEPVDVSPEQVEPPDLAPELPEEILDLVEPPDIVEETEPDVCVPDCEDKDCGPDGCDGTCGTCEADCVCGDGKCLGCGPEQYEEIQPSCIHVPYMVGAGTDVPIAVWAETTSCAQFDHVDVAVDGSKVTVKLMGKKMEGPCPPCIFNYAGIIWVDPLDPGGYIVTVGDLPSQYVIASAGIIEEPACEDDCAEPLNGGWTLTRRSVDLGLEVSCGGYQNMNSPASFDGGCEESTLACDQWDGPTDVRLCTETDVFFDITDPSKTTTASRCYGPWGMAEQMLIGLTLGENVEMFLFEK